MAKRSMAKKQKDPWFESLTPEERRWAKEEDQVREMAAKLTVSVPQSEQPPTPEEAEAARKEVLELFYPDTMINRAIAMIFGRRSLEKPPLVVAYLTRCASCELPIPSGTETRMADGVFFHVACATQVAERLDYVERRSAFMKKYEARMRALEQPPPPTTVGE